MGEGVLLPRPRVLLVEDHPQLGPSIQQALIREGFEVELATTLQAALRRILQDPRPQLIVLDLNLPDADKLEAVRALRAFPFPIRRWCSFSPSIGTWSCGCRPWRRGRMISWSSPSP